MTSPGTSLTASSSRLDVLAIGVLILASIALWMPRLSGPLDLRYDAGVYYVLGTALGEGRGYRLLNEPGAIEAVQYPPLLPMMIAAHQWLVGSVDPAVVARAMRLTFAALFVTYGLAVYAFGRRWLPPIWALVAALFVILNIQVLWLSDALFADFPFACAVILFLLIAERDDRRGIAAMLGAAAYLLRSTGIALLAAWVVDALLQRRVFEAALRAGLAALPIFVWQAYVGEVQSSVDYRAPAYAYQRAPYNFYNVDYAANLAYVDAFAPERGWADGHALVRRVIANVQTLPARLGESISVRAEGPLPPVFRLTVPRSPPLPSLAMSRAGFGLVGLVAIVGLGLLFVDGFRLAPLYWAASVALMVLTPWPAQFARYLVPLAPITAVGLVIIMANGALSQSRLVQTASGAAIGILLAAQLLTLGVVFSGQHQALAATSNAYAPERLFYYDAHWRQHDAALAWLAGVAKPTDVIATSTPHRVYLASGLRAVMPPFEADPAQAQRLLDSVPVAYLVIDDLDYLDVTRRYGDPVVAAYPQAWQLVHGTAGAGSRIYRRVRH